MWHAQTESLNDGRIQKLTLISGDAPIPYADALVHGYGLSIVLYCLARQLTVHCVPVGNAADHIRRS